jgi:monoamine oxidase
VLWRPARPPLARELGVGKFNTYDKGDNVYVADGARTTYSDTGISGTAPPDPLILGQLATVVAELDAMAKTVPVGAPWKAPNAAKWDGITLESFLDSHSPTKRFTDLVAASTRPIFGAEPRELSLLFSSSSRPTSDPGPASLGRSTRRAGQASSGRAGARWGYRAPERSSPTAVSFASRSGGSTGPGPRHRRSGTDTWTAPCAPASVLRPR